MFLKSSHPEREAARQQVSKLAVGIAV